MQPEAKPPAKPEPHDLSQTGPGDDAPDPRRDVAHDRAEAAKSREARPGEEIAGKDEPLRLKARELRALSDEQLVALAERASESERWLDLARRSQAEFENFQKRLTRERQEDQRFALTGFAREMLAVSDNLERATEAAEKAGATGPLLDGVKLTQSLLLKAFMRFGIAPIEALDKPFDPAEHEALMMGNDATRENNTVLQVFERGWRYHDRVLRAAKVVVNKK
jgi:molecular chaperone GrpE